ncbi:MAG: lipopolysaccharide transport periplasmic protein LptA [Porticoccaceae bacterium]|nr:lipopolysaccharide transport periplasmic protein LptA [Porticoccaceae bacterium]
MKVFKSAVVFVNLLFLPLAVFAQTLDNKAPITINAASAERNDRTGVTKYLGNVSISQGNLSITAERVTIVSRNKRVAMIQCDGDPAVFRQHANSGHLVGMAQTIEYSLVEQTINLTSNASLSRNGTNLKGDTINYDLQNETWKARGNDGAEQNRIQLVILPSASNNADSKDSLDTAL